ncbi:MAG: hypothetical protein V2I45_06835 [Halieaceae bacterium]|nr:hypothetical protein [Halieaceae bacterium]
MLRNRMLPVVLGLMLASAATAVVDSNMPGEGVIPVATLPADIVTAAAERCPGMLINKASFKWMSDTGMYIVEGRCKGADVRIHITGEGRVDYFTKVEKD